MQELFKPLEIKDFEKRDILQKFEQIMGSENSPITTINYNKGVIEKREENKKTIQELKQLLVSYKNEKNSSKKSKIKKEFEEKVLFIRFDNLNSEQSPTRIKSILKIPLFGGRDPMRYERSQTLELQNQLEEVKKRDGIFVVPIKIGKNIYKVYEIAKHDNNVDKADIKFLDVKGRAIAWASLKKGSTSKDFQQWSGISDKAGSFIASHSETKYFIDKVKTLKENTQDQKVPTFSKRINDDKLKKVAIFGDDYSTNTYKKSPNNVNTVIQNESSKLRIVKESNYYIIVGDLFVKNNSLPSSYDPTFVARPDSKRNDAGIQKTRVGIFPRDYRSKTFEI